MGKQVICKVSLRPRIAGKAIFIQAGIPFDEEYVDTQSKKQMLDKGILEYVEDKPKQAGPPEDKKLVLKELKAKALEEHGVELKGKDFNTVEKVADKLERLDKAKNAPKGIFKAAAEELEGFNLDELDAMHAEVCAVNNLPDPVPFESVEQGIAKLTGKTE